MDDNFTYLPCNFNAVTEGQFFLSQNDNFTLPQLIVLEFYYRQGPF